MAYKATKRLYINSTDTTYQRGDDVDVSAWSDSELINALRDEAIVLVQLVPSEYEAWVDLTVYASVIDLGDRTDDNTNRNLVPAGAPYYPHDNWDEPNPHYELDATPGAEQINVLEAGLYSATLMATAVRASGDDPFVNSMGGLFTMLMGEPGGQVTEAHIVPTNNIGSAAGFSYVTDIRYLEPGEYGFIIAKAFAFCNDVAAAETTISVGGALIINRLA